jgi:hypothetical protein
VAKANADVVPGERKLLGIGLVLCLLVLAYSAHHGSIRFTLIAECVSAGLLAVALGMNRVRQNQPSDPGPSVDTGSEDEQ